MGVTVLPIWLVLTGLLDFIGQSTCILTFEDSFKAVYSHTPVLASSRSVVTKMLTEGESPLSAMEYGQKITGKYSSTYASASKATHGKTQVIEKDLEEKVLSKLHKIQYRKLGDAFTQDAQEKYSDMMNKLLGNLVTAFTGKDETKNWKNSDLLDGLLEPDQNYLIAQQEQLLSKVFNNLNENNGIERIKELKTKSFYPRLQATDKEIKFFHEVLKVAYYKGGELLIAIHHQSLLEPQERVRLSVLQYLTGMNSIQARSGYEKNLEAEYQVNANKGEQRIGLLKSKLLKLTLEQNNSDLNYDSKEHSLISKKCNPWIKSLLDQPIGNKLDHATLGNLIDHPSQEKPENFSQIFNGDPDSKTPSDSYIICNIHNIMKELDLITKSDNDDLFLKQVKINDILKRPALLYQYNVKEQDHGIQRKNTQIFSNQG
ncbi:hypothetical protein KEM48_013939 [Puccinia striiformis f. sp. tritici PST-130]|nr:hypothetical protein KEM48_013939 [Puccinia striiformis f. sp. tritici PST-130]